MSPASYPAVKIGGVKIWAKIGRLLGRIVPIGLASTSAEHPSLGRRRRFTTFLRGMALGADPTRLFGRPVSMFKRPLLPQRSLTVWEEVGNDLWNVIDRVDRELREERSPSSDQDVDHDHDRER